MGTGQIKSRLILIEQEELRVYFLDDRTAWTIGRVSGEEIPDIPLVTPTISRSHGLFKNKGGFWMYSDSCKQNGTTYNGKPLTVNYNHKILEDGDVLVFGGRGRSEVNSQTVLGIYLEREISDLIFAVETEAKEVLCFTDGITSTKFVRPKIGTLVDNKGPGLGIYLGNITYLLGNIRLE